MVRVGYVQVGRRSRQTGLALSLKLEKHLETLMTESSQGLHGRSQRHSTVDQSRLSSEDGRHRDPSPIPSSLPNTSSSTPDYSLANSPQPPNAVSSLTSTHPYYAREDLEEKALSMAIEELYEESGRRWRPWAANARSIRVGEIILIVDSDTIVPEDCLRDAGGITGKVRSKGHDQPAGQREGASRPALHPKLCGPRGSDPGHAC